MSKRAAKTKAKPKPKAPRQRRQQTLTYERARELFDYNTRSGHLTRRIAVIAGNGGIRYAAGTRAGYVWRCKRFGKVYRSVTIDGIGYREHTVIFLWMTGRYPEAELDHIDGDGANNRWRNLREATRAQNCANKFARSDSSTGLKGVAPRRDGTFQAKISVTIYLGRHKTAEAAHAHYVKASAIVQKQFANVKTRVERELANGRSIT